jgi:hypothetical protein
VLATDPFFDTEAMRALAHVPHDDVFGTAA